MYHVLHDHHSLLTFSPLYYMFFLKTSSHSYSVTQMFGQKLVPEENKYFFFLQEKKGTLHSIHVVYFENCSSTRIWIFQECLN